MSWTSDASCAATRVRRFLAATVRANNSFHPSVGFDLSPTRVPAGRWPPVVATTRSHWRRLCARLRDMSEHTPMVRCRLGFATCAIFALALLSASRADAKQPSASGIKGQSTGSFQFVDPGSNHPITVWFCRPPTLTSDTRIVFVMHGSESQTARQACSLATPHLETLNAIVLAPQFAEGCLSR